MRAVAGVALIALASCNLVFQSTTGPDAANGTDDAATKLVCPPLYIEINDSKSQYRVFAESLSWTEAQQMCSNNQIEGGSSHLIVFDSMAELTVAHEVTKALNRNYWIGATDVKNEGTFEAIVDDPPMFPPRNGEPPWAAGQPSDMNETENCAFMVANQARIADDTCSQTKSFICECDRSTIDTSKFPVQ